ncbi:MAG: hypothetical protein HDR23_07230 [Lachnospiraceae bacterium]|nr:hypothetical protein [Lachnospiraceae bacterium]
MPQTEIEIHFSQMKGLSRELQDIAKNLRQTVDISGLETISRTKAAWISVHADDFVRKEGKLFEKIGETAANLNAISTEIFEKAEKIYKSEQQNTLAARIRSYL